WPPRQPGPSSACSPGSTRGGAPARSSPPRPSGEAGTPGGRRPAGRRNGGPGRPGGRRLHRGEAVRPAPAHPGPEPRTWGPRVALPRTGAQPLQPPAAPVNLGVIVPAQTLRRGCAVLTAALATAALTACTAGGAGGAGSAAGSAGHSLVPGISGPPAIKPNPYAGSIGDKVRPHITPSAVPLASSAEPVSLPLDAYIQASVQQSQTLDAAAAQVAQRCTTAAGFSFPVQPKPDDQTLISQFLEHQDGGLASLTQARAYGFQQPPGG